MQNLMCTRIQQKEAVTSQETDPGLPGSAQESPAEAWVTVAAAGAGALGTADLGVA